MNKKIFFSALIFCGISIITAQETITFSDFISEDGSGIEKLQLFQEKRADKKEFYTTIDSSSDACELVDLITVLLDEAVMKKVRELSYDQGMIVLKSHLLWWKYFAAHPSLPNVNGSARGIYSLSTDFMRIKSRWEAVKLPYEQYLIYAKIANFCQVRLNCGNYKMRFGEVCLKKEACWAYDADAVKTFGKYYHDFPISILPETCRNNGNGYIAVLQSAKTLYLCIWDQTGSPLAVHPLKDVKKIVSTVPDSEKVEVTCIDKQEKQCKFIFNLNERNQTKISTGEK